MNSGHRRPVLSAVLIAQDNESTIRRVIDNVARVVDEVVVVDGGSEDRTAEIAAEHQKCRVFHRAFDDFAQQKNYAIDQARGRWILLVDTDELLGQRSLQTLRWWIRLPFVRWYKLRTCHLVTEDDREQQVFSQRHYPDNHLRLFRNQPFFRYDTERGRVHESFPRKGRGFGICLPLHIFHYGYAMKSLDQRRQRIQLYDQIAGSPSAVNSMYLWEEDPGVTLIPPKESAPPDSLLNSERGSGRLGP